MKMMMNIYFCQAGYDYPMASPLDIEPPEPAWMQAFIFANTRNQARYFMSRNFDIEYTDRMQILQIGTNSYAPTTTILNAPLEHPLWNKVPWNKVREIQSWQYANKQSNK